MSYASHNVHGVKAHERIKQGARLNTEVPTTGRTIEEMRRRLEGWSELNGVTPERMLALRGTFVPACEVFQFAMDAGLCLPALLHELDRYAEYLREANA